jgi:hypothetical protein
MTPRQQATECEPDLFVLAQQDVIHGLLRSH